MTRALRRDDGTTLVELLVTMFLMSIISGLVLTAVIQAQRVFVQTQDEDRGLQDAKVVLDRLGQDTRQGRAVVCDGGLADPSDPSSADPYCASHLQLWVDTNSDYIKQDGEIITWRLKRSADAEHYDVLRSLGTSPVVSTKVQATSLVHAVRLQVRRARRLRQPEVHPGPADQDRAAVRRHRRPRHQAAVCRLLGTSQEQGSSMTTFAARVQAARESRDEGMGLILVIGIAAFVFALAITASAYAVNGTRQSKNRQSFEVSLATAEAGVDGTMSRLQTAFSKYNADYPIPSNVATPANPAPSCVAPSVSWPAVIGGTPVSDAQGNFFAAGGRTAEQNERLWASTQLKALVGISGCVSTAAGGQYVVLKPVSALVDGKYPKFGKVYSYASVPSFVAGKCEVAGGEVRVRLSALSADQCRADRR